MTTADDKQDTTTTRKVVSLKLNEDNELSFKLQIEGTISDPEMAKPQFRFTLTEDATDRGWIFPMTKTGEDIVSVSIPAVMTEKFSPGQQYNGKLEVILGRLYFSPSEMVVEFTQPVAVKALEEVVKTEVSVPKISAEPILVEKKPASQPPVSVVKNMVSGMTMDRSLVSETIQEKSPPPPSLEEEFATNRVHGKSALPPPVLPARKPAPLPPPPKQQIALPPLTEQERIKLLYKRFMKEALKS